MTAFTDRTLPACWALCESCSRAAGLPLSSRGGDAYCPACTARAVLVDAAEQSLSAEVSPILGAWASQWAAAGLPESELTGIVDMLSGATYNEKYRAAYVRGHLARLRREYRAPAFERQKADRAELEAGSLPTLVAYHWADMAHPSRGHSWPYFVDTSGKTHTLMPGCDTLAVSLPGGDALLIYTGMGGHTDLTRQHGFRVPARMLAQVRAALAGEE